MFMVACTQEIPAQSRQPSSLKGVSFWVCASFYPTSADEANISELVIKQSYD